MPPMICAVMVTGKPGREYLARLAIEAFRAQTYPHKRLLIVNDGQPVLISMPPGVRELHVPPGKSLGELRNLALTAVDAGVTHVVQWDDDDYSDPLRLQWQAEQMGEKSEATVLRYEVHCNLHSGATKLCMPTKQAGYGFAGTIMHPWPTEFQYPIADKGEDTDFIRLWRGADKLRVLVNERYPTLYIRFFHGLNTWSEQHVMGFPPAKFRISEMAAKHIESIRKRYLAAAKSSAAACSR